MVAYANSKNVKLLAYAYPCLAFQAQKQHIIGNSLDISPPEVQDWWIKTMKAFMHKTGSAGFAWDHDIFAGKESLRYMQWRGWMRILAALRAEHPDMVMDHRQTAHRWGPWYHPAGSYSEPIAGDENPETYGVPINSLHTDHVAADNTRRVNYIYATQQYLPHARIPGFIFHQTERTADNGTNACFGNVKECWDSNTRDFDLLGYKVSGGAWWNGVGNGVLQQVYLYCCVLHRILFECFHMHIHTVPARADLWAIRVQSTS
jgi:hypothetical protein